MNYIIQLFFLMALMNINAMEDDLKSPRSLLKPDDYKDKRRGSVDTKIPQSQLSQLINQSNISQPPTKESDQKNIIKKDN